MYISKSERYFYLHWTSIRSGPLDPIGLLVCCRFHIVPSVIGLVIVLDALTSVLILPVLAVALSAASCHLAVEVWHGPVVLLSGVSPISLGVSPGVLVPRIRVLSLSFI